MKAAVYMPILKNGDSSLVENYKPISILEIKCYITSTQHGLQSGKSTTTVVLNFVERI